jgi:calcineurin-like phosphoesterase family protein
MSEKIFLTSNTYFGRLKALKLPKRSKYSSVEEMNNEMINIWNKNITDSDIVFHLGYFAHDPFIADEIAGKLNGKITFFNNETDKAIHELIGVYDNISFFEGQIFELVNKNSILSYYPMDYWGNNNVIHFYGDEHIITDLELKENRICVAFDVWGKPICIDDCISIINDFNNSKLKKNNVCKMIV